MRQTLRKWLLRDRQVIVNNKWLTIQKSEYQLPDGSHISDFYTVVEHEGINIVALTTKKEVLLVQQYRPAVDSFVYDFPAGFVEEGDSSFLSRAQAELLEETGYQTDTWYYTGSIHPAPHRLSKTEHCFLAVNVTKIADQCLDQTEFVDYMLVPINELHEMIRRGEFNCGICIASFFRAMLVEKDLMWL